MNAVSRVPAFISIISVLLLGGCSNGAKTDDAAERPFGKAGPPPIKVFTIRAEKRPFGEAIETVGSAKARESVEITSKSANTITAIRFQEGQRVVKGAVLIEFDRAQTAAALSEATATLNESRSQFNRGRDLSVRQALSRAQLDQLETNVKTGEARVAAARARLEDTIIRAPFSGRIGLRRVSLGGLVNPGSIITTLDDASMIKLEFSVPQSFLKDLVVGLPVEARTDGLGDRVYRGKISTLDSRIDPATRSLIVNAELPNADGTLRPGLFMSVKLRGAMTPTLMLPEEALVPEQGRTFVFVVVGNKAQKREVQIGGREPGSVAILTGLNEADTVIAEGTQRVREGSVVNAQPRQ